MLTREREGFRDNVAMAYVEGLAWVLRYYFQGCPSWTWYYPYHYAPFAADFVELDKMEITFDKGKPSKPFEQLMGVLPAASNHAIPEVFHPLMEEEDSEIIDFYPADLYVLLFRSIIFLGALSPCETWIKITYFPDAFHYLDSYLDAQMLTLTTLSPIDLNGKKFAYVMFLVQLPPMNQLKV